MLCLQFFTILSVAFLSNVIGAEHPCDKNQGCHRVLKCMDRQHCKTAYGDSPLDISLYGTYQPCQDYGKVRCLDPLQIEESSLEDVASLTSHEWGNSESSMDLSTESTTESDLEEEGKPLTASISEVDLPSSLLEQSAGNQQIPDNEPVATTVQKDGESQTENTSPMSNNEYDTTTSDSGIWNTISYASDMENPTVLGQVGAASGTGSHDVENPAVLGQLGAASGTGTHDAENPAALGQLGAASGTGTHDVENPATLGQLGDASGTGTHDVENPAVLGQLGAASGTGSHDMENPAFVPEVSSDTGSQQQQTDILQEFQEQEAVIIVDLSDETIEDMETAKPDHATEGAPSQPPSASSQVPTFAFVPVILNGVQVYVLASVIDQHTFGGAPLHPHGVPVNGMPNASPIYQPYPSVYHQAPSGLNPGKITSLKQKLQTVLKRKKNALKSLIRNKLRNIKSRTFFKLDH